MIWDILTPPEGQNLCMRERERERQTERTALKMEALTSGALLIAFSSGRKQQPLLSIRVSPKKEQKRKKRVWVFYNFLFFPLHLLSSLVAFFQKKNLSVAFVFVAYFMRENNAKCGRKILLTISFELVA